MSTVRGSCLLVLSASSPGVTAQSFVQAYNLAATNFTVQLATPDGKTCEFVDQDEHNRRWFNEFRSKSASTPISLESVDANRYAALLIPPAPGAVNDLAHNTDLADILNHFIQEKKPICAIGMGTVGLCPAIQKTKSNNNYWNFQDYSMTAPSVLELARKADFANLPIIPEDFIKDNGASYSSSECDAIHIIVDRHLVTGQNVQSTLIAVQNLILLCNQK
ncbi:glutamine amidotransferase-like class 1 domain-containing protein 1 isoform X1 [Argonauta hians]